MKVYTLNEEGQRQVVAFVAANGNARPSSCSQLVSQPGSFGDAARQSWFNDAEFSINNGITAEGHFEIPARYSRTGNPITCVLGLECFDVQEFEDESE